MTTNLMLNRKKCSDDDAVAKKYSHLIEGWE